MLNLSRRKFLGSAVLAAASPSLLPFSQLLNEKLVGVQLYSVRDTINDDTEGTIQSLAKIGFNYVEGFGYNNGKIFGKTPSEFRKILKEYEMKMPSAHFGLTTAKHYDYVKKDFTDDFKKAVEDALKMGQRYFINPWTDNKDRKTLDAFKNYCEFLNKVGEYCNTQAIRFGYHNHWFEFDKLESEVMYDYMLKTLTPENVTFELDICWSTYAKRQPVDLFKSNPGRFELLHLKDLSQENDKETVILGQGKVDFDTTLENMKKGGARMLILELEHYEKTPVEDLKVCYKNIKKLLKPYEK